MRKFLSKTTLAATLVLAITLTLSCAPDETGQPNPSSNDGNGNGTYGNNYAYCVDDAFELCYEATNGVCILDGFYFEDRLSNECPYVKTQSSNSSISSSSSSRLSPSSSSTAPSSSSSSSSLPRSSSSVGGYCNWAAIGGEGCWPIKNETERMDCGTAVVATCPSVVPSSSSSRLQSSSSSKNRVVYGSPVTYGGETYQTIVLGSQTWMARNLNYNASGSVCYNNQYTNCEKYGRLYDWATAMALPSDCNSSSCSSQIGTKHKGICPSGWHIPSDVEWGSTYGEGLSGYLSYMCNYEGVCDGVSGLIATSGWDFYSLG